MKGLKFCCTESLKRLNRALSLTGTSLELAKEVLLNYKISDESLSCSSCRRLLSVELISILRYFSKAKFSDGNKSLSQKEVVINAPFFIQGNKIVISMTGHNQAMNQAVLSLHELCSKAIKPFKIKDRMFYYKPKTLDGSNLWLGVAYNRINEILQLHEGIMMLPDPADTIVIADVSLNGWTIVSSFVETSLKFRESPDWIALLENPKKDKSRYILYGQNDRSIEQPDLYHRELFRLEDLPEILFLPKPTSKNASFLEKSESSPNSYHFSKPRSSKSTSSHIFNKYHQNVNKFAQGSNQNIQKTATSTVKRLKTGSLQTIRSKTIETSIDKQSRSNIRIKVHRLNNESLANKREVNREARRQSIRLISRQSRALHGTCKDITRNDRIFVTSIRSENVNGNSESGIDTLSADRKPSPGSPTIKRGFFMVKRERNSKK
jgi:hypothetical protein